MSRWIASLFILISLPGFLPPALAEAHATAKPKLLLVYWSSRDCPWCAYWESSRSGMERSLKSSKEFKKLTYRVVKNDHLADPYIDSDYPPDIKWLKERVDWGEEKNPGRPGWVFYAGKVRVASFYGTKDWNSRILPEMKRLVAKYSADAHPVAPREAAR